MAVPSGGGGRAPAAPTNYPVLSAGTLARVAAHPPAAATQPTPASVAAGMAHATVADTIAAIHAAQAQDREAAAAEAALTNRAALATAHVLQPLAGLTARDYAAAVNQTRGLAEGYSGQLRQDLTDQANAANATLASITGNNQHVTAPADSLANYLYGTRGSLPGQALAGEGLAATTMARTLPANLLATGQNDALGLIGAGRADAARLDPQIVAATGKLGSLTNTYLNQILTQQQRAQSAADLNAYRTGELTLGARRIDAADAKTAADQTYRAAYLTHLQNGDSERVAHDKAMEAAGEAYHTATLKIAGYNAQTSRINARTSARRAAKTGGLSVSGFNSAFNTAAGLIQRGAQGQGGSVVQAPSGTDPTNEIKDAQGNPTGFVVSPVAGVVPYQTARQNALVLMPAGANPKAWAAKVQTVLDANYPPGQNGRFWQGAEARSHALTGAKVALSNGVAEQDAVAGLVANWIPPQIARETVRRIYSKAYYAANRPKHPGGSAAGVAAGNRLAAATLAGA